MPCLRRSGALLYCARNNWCCSDPVSAPAQLEVRAVAFLFSMTPRGEEASSLTACLLSPPSHCALILRAPPGRPAVASLSVLMLRLCHRSRCRFTERTDTSSRMRSCLFPVTNLGGNPAISSPLGHCHLGPRLSCRHVRLETLFRRAWSFCVISIAAIAPSLRSGGAAYCLFAHVRTHAYTRMHTRGGERRGTYAHKGLYADNNPLNYEK